MKEIAQLFRNSFEKDPVITDMLLSVDKLGHLAHLPRYFITLLTAAAINGGKFDEAND